MDVTSVCPLRVASVVWQPRPGAFALTVVCKATFALQPGTSPLAATQDEPNLTDVHWRGDPSRSLVRASDLSPFKRRADILFVGHAHAPDGKPVTSLLTRLVVGEVDKLIEVHGERRITADDRVEDPRPFVRASLRWERAAGGPCTNNPVGTRLDVPDTRGAVAVPTLTPPGFSVTGRHVVIPPIGYGPIAPTWPERQSRLRRRAATWDHLLWNVLPLPDDIDGGYFNAAPADQQVAEIRPDERIVLEHLSPDHERLVTNLQPISPRVLAGRRGEPGQLLRMRCDTLWIDGDRAIVSLVWRGTQMLDTPDQDGFVVVTAPGLSGPAPLGATLPADRGAVERRAALPFSEGPPDPTVARPAGPITQRPTLGDTVDQAPSPAPPHKTLPFAAPLAEPPNPEAGAIQVRPIVTIDAEAEGPVTAPMPILTLGQQAMMFVPQALTLGQRAVLHAAPAATPAPERTPSPAPPAMPSSHPPSPLVAELPAPGLPLRAYPIERCARIAASIARRSGERAAILARHDLSAETWDLLDQHWSDLSAEEQKQGKTALVRAYDAAYVAQLEEERGPLTAEEVARLLVAKERRLEAETLAALDLPRGALLRVERVWLEKTAADPALARRVREAIDAAEG